MLPRHSMNRATASARSELGRGRQESQPRRLHCDNGSGRTRPCAHSTVIRVKRACSGLDVFLPKGSCVKSLVPSTAILGSEAEPQGVRPSGKSFGIPGPWSFPFPFCFLVTRWTLFCHILLAIAKWDPHWRLKAMGHPMLDRNILYCTPR